MENVSKALLIAGGMLIAIVILSMFLIMYNKVANISNVQEEQKKQEQLSAFNGEFEAYDKQLMYGVDVITLCNKIREHNRKYSNAKARISFVFQGKEVDKIELIEQTDNGKYATIYDIDNNELFKDADFLNDFDKKLFKCTEIEYGNEGKINKVIISIAD